MCSFETYQHSESTPHIHNILLDGKNLKILKYNEIFLNTLNNF